MKAVTFLGLAALLMFFGCRSSPTAEHSQPRIEDPHAQQTPTQMFGGHWLAMSRDEKEHLVSTFISGFTMGQFDLCHAEQRKIGEYMHAHKLQRLFYPEDCEELIVKYSHFGTSGGPASAAAYVKVLDDFYGHSECRMIPYDILLDHLDDKEFVDGNTLFENVRAGRVNLGILEIDDVENCYGVLRNTR